MASTLKTTIVQEPSSAVNNLTLDTSGGVTVGQNLSVTGTTSITGATTFTTNVTSSGTVVMSSPYTMRNKIINGAMVIDQRNAGASVTITNTGANTYTVDRWFAFGNVASKFSVQQNANSVTPPTGFINYLGALSLAATTVNAGDQYILGQAIEGFNIADLAWGTASAQAATLSFRVYSSLTGTFGGAIRNSAGTRSYPFTYTISSANTWTTISVAISGETSGTWVTNNGVGIYIYFGLGVGSTYLGTAGVWSGSLYTSATGSTNVVSTNAATFYITGVQLERGTVATPFEYRNYQQELAMCQRYFVQFGGDSSNDQVGAGQAFSATAAGATIRFPVTMRANPTLDSFTASNWSVMRGDGSLTAATAIVLAGGQTNRNGTQLSITTSSVLTTGQGSSFLANTSAARLPFNAEL